MGKIARFLITTKHKKSQQNTTKRELCTYLVCICTMCTMTPHRRQDVSNHRQPIVVQLLPRDNAKEISKFRITGPLCRISTGGLPIIKWPVLRKACLRYGLVMSSGSLAPTVVICRNLYMVLMSIADYLRYSHYCLRHNCWCTNECWGRSDPCACF